MYQTPQEAEAAFYDAFQRADLDAMKKVWADDDDVLLEVIDSGPGIPYEHQQRVFERFYRVDKARSRELGGTGLGLAIVKHLVQTFSGSVGVESQPGDGSRFFVRLPAASQVA